MDLSTITDLIAKEKHRIWVHDLETQIGWLEEIEDRNPDEEAYLQQLIKELADGTSTN